MRIFQYDLMNIYYFHIGRFMMARWLIYHIENSKEFAIFTR